MDRSNHYEAAFEAYLQDQRLAYIAVDETRRSQIGDDRVKSLDFIVHGPAGASLLVDVKGRRFPGGPADRPRRVWESWALQDDIRCLETWTGVFGLSYRGLLVFAYDVAPAVELPVAIEDLWAWRSRRYLFRAVDVVDYRRDMRVRSRSWDTVTLPRDRFRDLVRPFRHFVDPCRVAEECPV